MALVGGYGRQLEEERTLPTARACQISDPEPGDGSVSRRSSSAQPTEDGSRPMPCAAACQRGLLFA